jgi:hypothetical protein
MVATGRGVAFLNTRTGELHAFQTSAHADAQRAHAHARQAERETAVSQYLAHVRSSSTQAHGLLGAIAGSRVRDVWPGIARVCVCAVSAAAVDAPAVYGFDARPTVLQARV